MGNPFEDDTDDEDLGNEGQASSTIQDLRKAFNRVKQEKKDLEARVEELSAFQATVVKEKRQAAVTSSFEEVSLDPRHVKLYEALNPDVALEAITAESVAAFAAEYGLVTTSGETVEAAAAPSGYTPVTTGQASKPSMLDRSEWLKLVNTDPAAAYKAHQEGRVSES